MYWVWRNLHNFAQWAGCAATNTPQKVTTGTPGGWLVPDGWTVHSTLWQAGGNDKSGVYWPFATVIYKGRNVAILIRGTQTEQDAKTGGLSCCPATHELYHCHDTRAMYTH